MHLKNLLCYQIEAFVSFSIVLMCLSVTPYQYSAAQNISIQNAELLQENEGLISGHTVYSSQARFLVYRVISDGNYQVVVNGNGILDFGQYNSRSTDSRYQNNIFVPIRGGEIKFRLPVRKGDNHFCVFVGIPSGSTINIDNSDWLGPTLKQAVITTHNEFFKSPEEVAYLLERAGITTMPPNCFVLDNSGFRLTFKSEDAGGVFSEPSSCESSRNKLTEIYLYSPPSRSSINERAGRAIANALKRECYTVFQVTDYLDYPPDARQGFLSVAYPIGKQNIANVVRDIARNAASSTNIEFTTFMFPPVSLNHLVVYLNF